MAEKDSTTKNSGGADVIDFMEKLKGQDKGKDSVASILETMLPIVDEIDFDDFKQQVIPLLYLLSKELSFVQSLSFALSVIINDMKGTPMPLKNRRVLAKNLGIDFDAVLESVRAEGTI